MFSIHMYTYIYIYIYVYRAAPGRVEAHNAACAACATTYGFAANCG